jgi:transcriptional regulator with XRE-family HTH domain
MSSEKLEISTGIIPEALKALRGRLGLTFEAMARRIGCSNSAYFQWESGRRTPSGDWLLIMMRLCPDAESLAAFGIRNLESGMPPAGAPPDPYEEDFRNLRAIIDSGQSQLIGHAEEVLARLADNARRMTRKSKSKK